MEETAPIKSPKPFASLAQLKRCDNLVTEGAISKDLFERDLLASNLENIPWRVGAPKEGDPDQEVQEQYRAGMIERKQAINTAIGFPALNTDAKPKEAYNPQGEGAQDGGEGLEAGRTL